MSLRTSVTISSCVYFQRFWSGMSPWFFSYGDFIWAFFRNYLQILKVFFIWFFLQICFFIRNAFTDFIINTTMKFFGYTIQGNPSRINICSLQLFPGLFQVFFLGKRPRISKKYFEDYFQKYSAEICLNMKFSRKFV